MHRTRSSRRSRALTAILASLALVLVACGEEPSAGGGAMTVPVSGNEASLGTPTPASGAPVKVGVISNGAGQGFDSSIDEPVAKATAKWINEYRGGIGGRPIEITMCLDGNDPGKAVDCANEMIRSGVVAVAYSANGQFEASWRVLAKAGVPTFTLAIGSKDAGSDPNNTFLLNNALAGIIDGPIGLAKAKGTNKVTVVAVDLPAATDNYRVGRAPATFRDAGIVLDLIAIPIGTPDMTPQMAQLVKKNPDGVINMLGNDAFCIAAFNGLRAAGFKGTITANDACISENTRQAIPAEQLKGVRVVTQMPLNVKDDPSTRLYFSVLDKYGDASVDRLAQQGIFMFIGLAGLDAATAGLTGEVNPASIIAAARAMPFTELPGSGGRHFRCNKKADKDLAAVCSNAVLSAAYDENGQLGNYKVVGDEPIAG
jgi:branched-chain amino acid transport system substrate-binding protein